jgi:hypothetical protein
LTNVLTADFIGHFPRVNHKWMRRQRVRY